MRRGCIGKRSDAKAAESSASPCIVQVSRHCQGEAKETSVFEFSVWETPHTYNAAFGCRNVALCKSWRSSVGEEREGVRAWRMWKWNVEFSQFEYSIYYPPLLQHRTRGYPTRYTFLEGEGQLSKCPSIQLHRMLQPQLVRIQHCLGI